MKQVRYRVFTIAQYEEEERWLNDMAAQGWLLTSVCVFRYEFTRGAPGEYVYRLQMLEHSPAHPESQSYLRFLHEMGVEYIGSVLHWVYLRRRAADGPFELFSDVASRVRHLRRIVRLLNVIVPLFCLEVVFWTFDLWRSWRMGLPSSDSLGTAVVLDVVSLVMVVVLSVYRRPMDRTLRRLLAEQQVRE